LLYGLLGRCGGSEEGSERCRVATVGSGEEVRAFCWGTIKNSGWGRLGGGLSYCSGRQRHHYEWLPLDAAKGGI